MGGEKIESVNEVKIDEFLRLFDGDVSAAVSALRRRSTADSAARRTAAERFQDAPIIVSVKNATKQYKVGRQKVAALNGVSLSVRQGEFIALTGSSGSGKSTLLQLIGGLDKPTGGTVEVDGVNLTQLSDHKLSIFRGQTIGFVFQFFYLQPFLKLGQNIEVPGMFARKKRTTRQNQVSELTKAVGLADRVSHLPKELSGGQMQRAAIARALFNKPKILLADEPTGNLDSRNSAAIIELFELIRQEYGTTIIVVTHDQAIAHRADREIALRDGVAL